MNQFRHNFENYKALNKYMTSALPIFSSHSEFLKLAALGDFPGDPVAMTLGPMQGTRVQSLTGELNPVYRS